MKINKMTALHKAEAAITNVTILNDSTGQIKCIMPYCRNWVDERAAEIGTGCVCTECLVEWKAIGIAAILYVLVSAVCTWLDESREERINR